MSRYAPSKIDPLSVDGPRPLVALVAALPASYRTPAETAVLLALACDTYGDTSSPGEPNLAAWTGLSPSTVHSVLIRLTLPTEHRPALLARATTTRGKNRNVWQLLLWPEGVGGSTAAETAQDDAPTPRRSGGWGVEPPGNPPSAGGHPKAPVAHKTRHESESADVRQRATFNGAASRKQVKFLRDIAQGLRSLALEEEAEELDEFLETWPTFAQADEAIKEYWRIGEGGSQLESFAAVCHAEVTFT